jgi:phage host-nuclease inhibitor protein Gam
LGQNDEISDEDMLTTEDKSKLEKQQKEIIKLKTQVSSFGSKEEEYSEMFANIKKELESLKKAKKG